MNTSDITSMRLSEDHRARLDALSAAIGSRARGQTVEMLIDNAVIRQGNEQVSSGASIPMVQLSEQKRRGEPQWTKIATRVPVEHDRWIRQAAAERGVTIGEIARMIIVNYLGGMNSVIGTTANESDHAVEAL